MNKNNVQPLSQKQLEEALLALLEKKPALLVPVLEKMFVDGTWEIPDACVQGIYAEKAREVDQLSEQVTSMTKLVARLNEQINGGMPATPSGRVDAIAAAKTKTNKASKSKN